MCARHYKAELRKRPGERDKQQARFRTDKGRFTTAKGAAKVRGITWALTFEEYAATIGKGCHYCGRSLKDVTGTALDRIDHAKGYQPGNVLPCCGVCNGVRNVNFTVRETEAMIRAVVELRRADGRNFWDPPNTVLEQP